jgi:hypothetical protein
MGWNIFPTSCDHCCSVNRTVYTARDTDPVDFCEGQADFQSTASRNKQTSAQKVLVVYGAAVYFCELTGMCTCMADGASFENEHCHMPCWFQDNTGEHHVN